MAMQMMGGMFGGGMGMGYPDQGYGGYGNQGYGGYGNQGLAGIRKPRRRWRPPCGRRTAPGCSPNPNAPTDLTGSYLGNAAMDGQGNQRMPHVIPNPFDNTILIQGTPQEYEQILGLLRQLDIAPRQVLIDAKIYEVDLTGAFAAGVTAYLEKKDTGTVAAAS